jgi:2-polyprenyl-6-methoxyphenol hydroxylase-like FAD-dependent oxidoreductase
MTATAAGDISTSVVIAGAGPVGLMLACELRRAGVPVVIVERLASPMTESRASQLSTLTAEMLHERGFRWLLGEAAPERRAHFGGLALDLSGVDSRFPGNWKVPQYRTESVLGQRAQELGATLLRAHELTGIRAADDQVVCEVAGPAADRCVRARYLVGCDGATSAVRRLSEFTSSGKSATKELLRADVTGIDIPDRRFERLEGGFAVASTRDGVTRVMMHAYGQAVIERTAPPAFPEIVRAWEKVTGEDISAGNAIWIDAFDNSAGQVDAYRQGRVLLAGDAAHWHMPIGGQALNVGIQDAVNLGWKLAGSVHGWAPPQVLDSYHEERHPVAARVLDYVAAQEMLLLGDRDIEPLRAVLAELIGLEPVRSYLARVVAGLDDRYGPVPGLAGRRFPNVTLRDEQGSPMTASQLTATEPVIVRLGPPASCDAEPVALPGRFWIRTVHVIPEPPDLFAGISTILLRPDGYIEWAGDNNAELSLKIKEWLGAQ